MQSPHITQASRFVIGRGSGYEFGLDETNPKCYAKRRSVPLRLAWRCVCRVPPGLIEHVERFVACNGSGAIWPANGYRIAVSAVLKRHVAQLSDRSRYEYVDLLVDLCMEAEDTSASSLSTAIQALDAAREQIAALLGLSVSFPLKCEQEFLDLRLPRFLGRHVTSSSVRGALVQSLRDSLPFREPLPTVNVAKNRLRFGPEFPGAIDAVRRYISKEASADVRDKLLETGSYRFLPVVPLALAITLVLTWLLPLTTSSIAVVSIFLVAVAAIFAVPIREFGWRAVSRLTAAVASVALIGIGGFGVGYAICALFDKDAFGKVQEFGLGYPFLVATSLGVAGGILGGELKSPVRILAHIQLLLFLGGLIGLVAVLLRIERSARRGG